MVDPKIYSKTSASKYIETGVNNFYNLFPQILTRDYILHKDNPIAFTKSCAPLKGRLLRGQIVLCKLPLLKIIDQ